ncbi:DMT family transporter [Lacinutrix iliipiscaria]|uniref:DMT family transporter n=1 Tax=Lacinutrix iliipiscaria TaxID=1230532 RepID=A0ABW5WJW8_9FLAO
MLKKAIHFMILSAFAFALLNAFVKSLNHFSAYQIVFFRSIGSLAFTVPFLIRNNISMYGNKKKLLIIRGLVGVTSMTLFFYSLKYLNMGTAATVRYISPIFAAIFALIFLKERIKPLQWLFLLIAFSGVLILKGFDSQINTIGLIYAIASAIFSGLVYVTIRMIGKGDHPVVIVNYFMIIAAIVGGVLAIPNWITPVGYEWGLLLSLGVFGYFGQFYMTKAFQNIETNQAAPLKYIEVIFTLLIGVIWFNEIYTLWSVLGILLIVSGLILNVKTIRK